eukprot:UN09866
MGLSGRYEIKLRVQTNEKSCLAIKRSIILRNFHWFMMYKPRSLITVGVKL